MSISPREARSIIRKARRRVAEGESISTLNLTAMMDIMTILLIFLIESVSISTSPLSVAVSLPPSSTHLPEPEDAKTVTIAPEAILVEGQPVVAVKNGDIDASEKSQGQFGIEIGKLKNVLAIHHEALYVDAAKHGSPGDEPQHELTIIADRNTPYRLLYAVMYTAGIANAKNHPGGPGFSKFRLIVLRPDPTR
jgi:biopolymer transport protein ExbD